MEITAVPLRPIGKGVIPRLWLGLGLLAGLGIAGALVGTQTLAAAARPAAAILAANAKDKGVVVTTSGLQYKVVTEGSGLKPTPADIVLVNYEGRLAGGEVFDSTAQHGGPAKLPVADMIPGFGEALTLMPVGSKYRFWIPPELGYGPAGAGEGAIPPNALLVFDVELLAVAPRGAGGIPR